VANRHLRTAPPKAMDQFHATPGWEDVFEQKRIDFGNLYASKDNEYPTKSGGTRRINWGWATVPPASTQTLPREITFNAAARTLQQYPIDELEGLRRPEAYSKTNFQVNSVMDLGVGSGVTKQSEVLATFELPKIKTSFGIVIGDGAPPVHVDVTTFMASTDLSGGDYNVTHYPPKTDPKVCEAACNADQKCQAWTYVVRGVPAGSGDCCLKSTLPCPTHNSICVSGAKKNQTMRNCGTSASTVLCMVDYTPPVNTSAPYYEVPVSCGPVKDTLRLLTSETILELRIFSDWTFIEAFWQKGRTAMTTVASLSDKSKISLSSSSPLIVQSAAAYPLKGIWKTPDEVRNAPRVYPKQNDDAKNKISRAGRSPDDLDYLAV